MPLDLQIGDAAPIPCRHCGILIRTSVANNFLKCPTCEEVTVVRVETREARVLVYTQRFLESAPVYRT